MVKQWQSEHDQWCYIKVLSTIYIVASFLVTETTVDNIVMGKYYYEN